MHRLSLIALSALLSFAVALPAHALTDAERKVLRQERHRSSSSASSRSSVSAKRTKLVMRSKPMLNRKKPVLKPTVDLSEYKELVALRDEMVKTLTSMQK